MTSNIRCILFPPWTPCYSANGRIDYKQRSGSSHVWKEISQLGNKTKKLSAETPFTWDRWREYDEKKKQARKGPELALRLERVGSVSEPMALISVQPPFRIPSTGASASALHALQGSEPGQAWGSAHVSWPKLLLFVGEAIYSKFCYGISAGIQHSTARLRITNVHPHTTHLPCLPWIVVQQVHWD